MKLLRSFAALVMLLCSVSGALANDISNSTWSETAAANTAAPPNGWPSGVVTPTQVSPMMRETMASIKRWYNRANPTNTSGGSANVQTLTYTVATAAYVAGDGYTFIAGFTNTGAATLNIDGLGAKTLKIGAAPLIGGEIIAGRVTQAHYDGTDFQLVRQAGTAAALLATDYGVRADGVTSDDVAMKAALDACATMGRTLVLPPGKILLTGAAALTVNGCNMVGVGVAPGGVVLKGTTFLVTSTTVTPFIFGNGGGGLDGINFYYPNQTGAVVYPPLFTDTSAGIGSMHWNNINILNAYDGFAPSVSSGGIGGWFISNSSMYALRDMFRIGSVGDYIFINNTRFNQGVWQAVNGGDAWFAGAVNAAAAVNTIFHVIAPTQGPLAVLKVANVSAFAWGFGVRVDAAPAALGFGDFSWSTDGVATIVDTTAGGAIHNFTMRCANCVAGLASLPSGSGSTGNRTAFKLGANGGFNLHDSNFNPAAGTLIETSGTEVYVSDSRILLGSVNDGNDYYFVKTLAGTAHIDTRNNFISGFPASTKHHGVYAPTAVSGVAVQNNRFIYVNDVLNVGVGGGQYLFTGNISESTTGTGAIITTGTGRLGYSGNFLDKPPVPIVSSCGAGASLGENSTVTSGFINIGSTTPTTSCVLTYPFTLGGGQSCLFQIAGAGTGVIGGSPAGTPPAWTITSSTNIAGGQVFYHCGSDR